MALISPHKWPPPNISPAVSPTCLVRSWQEGLKTGRPFSRTPVAGRMEQKVIAMAQSQVSVQLKQSAKPRGNHAAPRIQWINKPGGFFRGRACCAAAAMLPYSSPLSYRRALRHLPINIMPEKKKSHLSTNKSNQSLRNCG